MAAISRFRTADRRFYGVAPGLVVDDQDPEGIGRVKVEFPWFSGAMVTEWCRVMQFYAGPSYGSYFVPEVDTEVLVAFTHGDMRYPIVLGGLYNGVDKPPAARQAGQDPKYIQTKAGHKISMEDADGQQRIEIVDASGNNSIVIDTTANTIKITAMSDVTVESTTGKLALKGVTVDIQATAAVTVSGATINLN